MSDAYLGSNYGFIHNARAYCGCYNNRNTNLDCSCGEENIVFEWRWELPPQTASRWVSVSMDKKQVTFHPYQIGSGMWIARGDTPLLPGSHYYWEIKILSNIYGADVMIGVGNKRKVNRTEPYANYEYLLGKDEDSYALSYRGKVWHRNRFVRENMGFCRGTIVGVRLDLWKGILEFYLNRQPQGVSFFDLNCHDALYPMITSTSGTVMRLTYASSWRASLLVDAAKILAASTEKNKIRARLPPGLKFITQNEFWLTLPQNGTFALGDTKVHHEPK